MRGAATIVGWRWMLPRHVGALAAAILVFLLILSSGLEPVRAAQPDAAKRAYDHGLQLAKERQIDGAAARVGVAASNFYPKFSLTSGSGAQSNSLLSLLSGATRLWNFGTSFQWGLLNYSATKANLNAAESRERVVAVEP